jgi:hypothetical protein
MPTFTNQKPSEVSSLLATLDPASVAASTVLSTWVPVKNHFALAAMIQTGVLGTAATVDAKLRQATDATGTGAKDITGKVITQIVKATGDNKQVFINAKVSDLDTEGGFAFVALSVTVGVAASLLSASVFGEFPRFEDASAYNQAAVVQVV